MLLMDDLFQKQNITCPEWLQGKPLDDEWNDSEYSCVDEVHKWVLQTPLKHCVISFSDGVYMFGAFMDDDFFVLETLSDDDIIIV